VNLEAATSFIMFCSRCERFNLQSLADGLSVRGYANSRPEDTPCTFCEILFKYIDSEQKVSQPKRYWWTRWPLIVPVNYPVLLWLTRPKPNTISSSQGIQMRELNAVGCPCSGSLTEAHFEQCSVTFQTAADPGMS
jgi:hypothetical protein